MKTILILSDHPDFAETIRSTLNTDHYRVVHRLNVDDAEPILAHGLASVAILDIDLAGVSGVWVIERLRRRAAKLPLIAYTNESQSEWEEEAFLQGVTHVLLKPVRGRLLNSLLERLWMTSAPRAMLAPAPVQQPLLRAPESPLVDRNVNGPQTLEMLRDFSSILTHSLDAERMLKQFLMFLREVLSINRAAIFLNRPAAPLTEALSPDSGRRLRAAAAIGLSSGLLEHFELSLDSGIGGQLMKLGRILRRDNEEARVDGETQKEFELLSAQVAVPIPDREGIVGVAVFDGRVTGEPLVNAELELIFHLLEQVGLALRNIWLHDQLAGNHEMMTDVLRELSSACVVIGRDLKLLHVNKAARRHFGHRLKNRAGDLEFSDLPQALGAKIYTVLKTGATIGPFRYQPENSPNTVYSISIVPFQRGESAVPASALLTADDLTQTEQLQHLQLEAANLRLIKSMADRLAHEIGNTMVPLSTHQQLLAEKFADKEFRESLDHALADGVRRVSRLINQMRFLARGGRSEHEAIPVQQLIEEAYHEALKHQPSEWARLTYENGGPPIVVMGERAALRHALAEVMLNALQANPKEPLVAVRAGTETAGGHHHLKIEVQDNGAGFTPEAAEKVPAPFFTTRTVGLGLGLTVCRRILESHRGKLVIPPPQEGRPGIVQISLPMEMAGVVE